MTARVDVSVPAENRDTDSEEEHDADEIENQICRLYNSCVIDKYLMRNFPTFTSEEVEDIVNDVFCYVLENIHKLHDKHKLKNWAYKIAKSFACMERNKRRDKPLDFYGDNFNDLVDKVIFASDNVTEAQRNKELKELVGELLDVLPPVCKKIMKLRYSDDLLLKEIGERLNLSYSNVRSMHARCLKLLRELLRESGVRNHDFYE